MIKVGATQQELESALPMWYTHMTGKLVPVHMATSMGLLEFHCTMVGSKSMFFRRQELEASRPLTV
jgi:hypothetical protein